MVACRRARLDARPPDHGGLLSLVRPPALARARARDRRLLLPHGESPAQRVARLSAPRGRRTRGCARARTRAGHLDELPALPRVRALDLRPDGPLVRPRARPRVRGDRPRSLRSPARSDARRDRRGRAPRELRRAARTRRTRPPHRERADVHRARAAHQRGIPRALAGRAAARDPGGARLDGHRAADPIVHRARRARGDARRPRRARRSRPHLRGDAARRADRGSGGALPARGPARLPALLHGRAARAGPSAIACSPKCSPSASSWAAASATSGSTSSRLPTPAASSTTCCRRPTNGSTSTTSGRRGATRR